MVGKILRNETKDGGENTVIYNQQHQKQKLQVTEKKSEKEWGLNSVCKKKFSSLLFVRGSSKFLNFY